MVDRFLHQRQLFPCEHFSADSMQFDLNPIKAEDYFASFHIDRPIGASNFSRVYLATGATTGRQVALKLILKVNQEETTINKEAVLDPSLNSPHLVKIFDIFEDIHMIMISMEYIQAGDLFEWICSKGIISESGISLILQHILLGVKELHDKNIVHRNIKPENILVSETEIGATIQLTDYCLANTIDQETPLSELCSTEICSAPEILKGDPYGPAADMWSIGVITYTLLCGRRPFEEDEKYPLFIKVSNGVYNFDYPEWEHISKTAKIFVKKLLEVDPNKRMTVDQALDHQWLNHDNSEDGIEASFNNLLITTMGRKLKRMMGAAQTAASFRQFTRYTQMPE